MPKERKKKPRPYTLAHCATTAAHGDDAFEVGKELLREARSRAAEPVAGYILSVMPLEEDTGVLYEGTLTMETDV